MIKNYLIDILTFALHVEKMSKGIEIKRLRISLNSNLLTIAIKKLSIHYDILLINYKQMCFQKQPLPN